MLRWTLVTLLSLSSPLISAASDGSCLISASAGGNTAQYDLSSLHKDYNYRVVDDRSDTPTSDASKYVYFFNICDQVDFEPIPGLDWGTTCINTTSPYNSSAYQYWHNKDNTAHCNSLGLWNTSSYKQGKALGDDLSKGVSIVYTNGKPCANGTPRTFYVTVYCDSQASDPDKATVHESSNTKCLYEVAFRSPLGCPLTCPVSQSADKTLKVCAGHGVCGNDHLQGPRCFCNKGYNGIDCSKTDDEVSEASCTGVCVGLIFVLILLIILLIGGSIIYYRVHKLSTMNITFSALTESFAANAGVENRADDEDDGDISMHTKNPIRNGSSHAAPSSSDFVVDDLND